jgi:chromate reductase, NAD(P)H dehydrogenase (quinone)
MNVGSSSTTMNQDIALTYRCHRWAPTTSVKAALRVALRAGRAGTPNEIMDNKCHLRVLAISGSLRRASSNSALVGAVARLAPDAVEVSIYRELESLPPFNPDLDGDPAPAAVARFRAALQACDAVLISSPEYAHGVPGVLKNALDWVVGSGELVNKPIALVNASRRATHAWASLADTLTVMSARVIPEASITVSLEGGTLDANGIVADAERSRSLRSAIEALAGAARGTHGV